MTTSKAPGAAIAALNDRLRTTLSPAYGRVFQTSGVADLPPETLGRVLAAVRAFSAFTPGNDPYGEHDFGSVEVDSIKVFWKIDCYQKGTDFLYGAETPEDAATTDRVLTIMLAEEY